MGVNIGSLIDREKIRFEHLFSKVIAVDANNMLYQFLALIRRPDGSLFTDSEGRVTSHLIGLAFRTTHLYSTYDIKFIFVFDGKPHRLKRNELLKRRRIREKAFIEWKKMIREGRIDKAFSKAVVSAFLTEEMIKDAKKVIAYMGFPIVQAPSDAEAQAAYIVSENNAWCVGSRDYDSILYGAPRLVRYLTISGTEFLPSLGIVKPLKPELITLHEVLKKLNITRAQLVDIAILVGTDFNEGVYGIGPRKAYKLIKKHGSIEKLPYKILEKINFDYNMVREIFLNPKVDTNYVIEFREPDIQSLWDFLVDKRGFSPKRVKTIIDRLAKHNFSRQKSIEDWIEGSYER